VNYNGHEFLSTAYEAGVRNFLVNEAYKWHPEMPEANILSVPDTLDALQKLAQWNRSLFQGPVIGITGSNGKTIVKEWLGQVIGKSHSVAKSPKSFNSQVGVPLSVLGLEDYHTVGIFEAGISQTKEMDKLEKIIRPSIGLFTNLGTAHKEGFTSKKEKLEEKLKLFGGSKYLIYRNENPEIAQAIQKKFPPEKLISWSALPGADYTLSLKKTDGNTKILLMQPDLRMYTFHTGFTDEASLENLRHVIVACLTLGLAPKEIEAAIQELKSVEMRLTLKEGINNSILIDDTYNNDLAGLTIALEFLHNQRPKNRKIIILSDLLQAGKSAELYEKIHQLLTHYQIDYLYGVGKEILLLQEKLTGKSKFFPDTQSLIQFLDRHSFNDDLILIKGARKFGFEKIVNALQERIHGTTLEVNLNAIRHNFNFYRSRMLSKTRVMVMVKAFAYGGGSEEIANLLEQIKADYLAVAYTDEGVYLRNKGIKLPIMVLNPERESFKNLLKYNLEPVVYSLEFLKELTRVCQEENSPLDIHLDLDTGMHRLGFEMKDIPSLLESLIQYPKLHVQSMFTHLAGAEDPQHKNFTLDQLESFEKMSELIIARLGYNPLMHALNSAGIIRYPEFQYEMVRLGIGLYGIEVNGLYDGSLQPVSTLKSTISQIKKLTKGQSIGYGRCGIMPEDGQIATIPIGYADGYDRRFGNGKGYMLLHGQKAPVIGNVCMDMCMINITGIESRVGDEVTVYGENISLKSLALAIGTIPYELLTNISTRVKRVYFLD
jgi:alanine racemase